MANMKHQDGYAPSAEETKKLNEIVSWFEEGYETEESNPVEDLKLVVNNPPNSLPIDGEARQLYYFSEWMKNKQNKH